MVHVIICCCLTNKSGEICIIKIADKDLCNIKGISPDAVTKIICTNTPNVCEAYMKKGTVNDVNVQSCTHYCAAYDLQCVEMYDDKNDCTRGSKYSTCDETGGGTSDHICVCGTGKLNYSFIYFQSAKFV